LQEELVVKVAVGSKAFCKGDSVLPHLHEAFALCFSCFEKVNTEAARLGLIKRKLVVPEVDTFSSVPDLADLIKRLFQVMSKLFKMVLAFA
jgi:hypothetical protein